MTTELLGTSCKLRGRGFCHRRALLRVALFCLLALAWGCGCRPDNQPTVVVYAAQDQVYAEPIFKMFTAETGIKVLSVYDSEAVKTVGLAQKLLAERQNPRCDVFWGNEEVRTRQLAAADVFANSNGWAAFGFRSRRVVVNTNLVKNFGTGFSLPLQELTNAAWRGRVAMAYPVFGTTFSHFLGLRRAWGVERWQTWCRNLAANKPFVVEGNSQVVKLVGRGEAWIGLTDSDDIAAGQSDGLPLAALPMTRETLLIPNTIGVVRNAPHPAQARELFRYLASRPVLDVLLSCQALEGATPGLRPHLTVNWNEALADLESASGDLKTIFVR